MSFESTYPAVSFVWDQFFLQDDYSRWDIQDEGAMCHPASISGRVYCFGTIFLEALGAICAGPYVIFQVYSDNIYEYSSDTREVMVFSEKAFMALDMFLASGLMFGVCLIRIPLKALGILLPTVALKYSGQ